MIVGDQRIALSEPSAQYALANMLYYAQARGIGTVLWGGARIFLDRSGPAKKLLGLQRHEHILGAMGFGYPAVRFKNKVTGKRLPIAWKGKLND